MKSILPVLAVLVLACSADATHQRRSYSDFRYQFMGHIDVLRDTVLPDYPWDGPSRWMSPPEFAVTANQLYQMTMAILQELPEIDQPEDRERADRILELLGENFWRFEYLFKELKTELIGVGVDYELALLGLQDIKMKLKALDIDLRDPRTEQFSDVPEEHWADRAIHSLRRAGILYGYPDGKFRG